MRPNRSLPAATFSTLFRENFSPQFVTGLLRRCGVLRRRPPTVSAYELIASLVFHVIAGAGRFSEHVKHLTRKKITDGALSQRRELLPLSVFEGMMHAGLKPKADPKQQPEAFYQGLRLCGIDGSTFSVTNTPQVKKSMGKAPSRSGRAAFPKVGAAVMVELGLHNPLAAALGAGGESEMALSKRVSGAQPEKSLLISDRYYGVPASKVRVLPNGVEPSFATGNAAQPRVLDRLRAGARRL